MRTVIGSVRVSEDCFFFLTLAIVWEFSNEQ